MSTIDWHNDRPALAAISLLDMAPESADIDLAAVRRYRGRQTGTLSQSNLFMVISMHELLNLGAFPLDRPK